MCGKHLAVDCNVFDGVFLCCPFPHEMSWIPPPGNFIAGRPKAALLFWFFGFGSTILDVVCCYLWFFSLYINITKGKNSC